MAIAISVSASVSADMKIRDIGDYRYRPIWKKADRSSTKLKDVHTYDKSSNSTDFVTKNIQRMWILIIFVFKQALFNAVSLRVSYLVRLVIYLHSD